MASGNGKPDENRVAIVTGSATGLGAAIALSLAERGLRVVINYSKSEAEAREAAAACEKAGVETLVVQADVAKDDDCRRLVAATVERFGRLDYLVNNAGITKFVEHHDLAGLDAEDFQRIYAVNVVGAFQMVRAAEPYLRQGREPAVVNVASIAAVTGIGSSIAYAASKGALTTMTLSLARVLGPEVRINALCPGFIPGRWLREGYGEERYEAMKVQVERSTPLKRAATCEEIAESALYFLLDAKLVTGETLIVDSGMHLGMAARVAR